MTSPAFSWNDCDVKTLIRKRIELHSMFTGKRGSALAGWQHIAELLGNGATHQQCKKKWENLLQRYRDIVSPLSAKDGLVSVRWQFFEELHSFVSVHQYVNTPLVCKPEQEQGIVTVHMPRSLLKCAPASPDAPTQEFADELPAANASLPAAAKKCKVEPKNRSIFEEGEVGYDSDLDDGSIHSIVETEEVPVIVEISEPACAARRVSQASECRCAACPHHNSLKRARVSEMCNDLSSSLPRRSGQPETRKISNREQHRQVMDTLQMEHRMRKHMLQAELEMTKRILQVELDIRQEELDFRRTFHRLQLKKLAQNLSSNS